MSETTALLKKSSTLDLFSVRLRSLWAVLLVATLCMGIVPPPALPAPVVYSFYTAKALLFLELGFLSPLAFSRFNSMNRAVFLVGV